MSRYVLAFLLLLPGLAFAQSVLLDADPTQDVRNTRRIGAVIAGGRLFNREALDRMLGDIERMANAN